ncbi:MAG: hypothetical protein R3E13_07275 [Alphaproteobacteria bacterium]
MSLVAAAVEEQVRVKNSAPILIETVLDFSNTKHVTDFTVNGNVSNWAKKGAARKPPSELTPAERCILTLAGHFNYSERAQEYYHTSQQLVVEKSPEHSVSLTNMLMNGGQSMHFHPNYGKSAPRTSYRILIAIPFANSSETEHSAGISFSAFELDSSVVDTDSMEAVGNPVTPQYKAHLVPGQIATIVFGGAKGAVHAFEGDGLILSIHPQDESAKMSNMYDAHTVSWNGPKELDEQVGLIAKPYSLKGRNLGYGSAGDLNGLVDRFRNEALRFVERIANSNYDPQMPVTPERINKFRADLRSHVVSGP